MSVIHFLNVNDGDCNIIQHDSGRITVIDICNGNAETEEVLYEFSNHRQKEHPVNPISYLSNLNIATIFRFVLTHPDMDHMDGIKKLFSNFSVINFWDTDNNKTMEDNHYWGKYDQNDWEFYQNIRESDKKPKTLKYLAGNKGSYYNQNEDGTMGGDGLYILSPTKELIALANESEDYNDISYVILLKEHGKKILFAGDSEEKAWDSILEKYEDDVTDIDILFAPHHGRKTGGNDEYLDILNPKLTLFGNAKSKHLDYDSWNNRRLEHITNNQANCVVLDVSIDSIDVYCSYKVFAKELNPESFYSEIHNAWYIGTY